jgi:hypothetical protein
VAADAFDCVYNCNTIHIAPRAVMDGLVRLNSTIEPCNIIIMYTLVLLHI